MASITRHPQSRFWTACFRDHNGRQRRVSTKETDKKRAQRIADEFEKAVRTKRTVRQTQTVLDKLHEELTGEKISRLSLREFAAQWLNTKAAETAPVTLVHYRGCVAKLLDFLAQRADSPLTEIVKTDLLAYRNNLSSSLTPQTANNHLALLRMLFKSARRDGVVILDPAEFVGSIRERRTNTKRPFTLAELESVLAVADVEWRSLIIFGVYTGQRLSDLASLGWSNIDLERGEVRLVTRKTGRTMVIPMAQALRSHIESLPMGEVPAAPLHPRAFRTLTQTGKTATLSNQFGDLLAQAGLRAVQNHYSHESRGIGHNGRREVNALSFHSLRRTATTWLHEAGVADAVAQSLIGHSSKAVHDTYISVGREALNKAVATLPSINSLL
jgi:integrase